METKRDLINDELTKELEEIKAAVATAFYEHSNKFSPSGKWRDENREAESFFLGVVMRAGQGRFNPVYVIDQIRINLNEYRKIAENVTDFSNKGWKEEGRLAGLAGKDMKSNPYKDTDNSVDWLWWDSGWKEGNKQRRAEQGIVEPVPVGTVDKDDLNPHGVI